MKKLRRALKIVLLAILAFLLVLTICNKALYIKENKELSNVGTNVKVNDTNLRVSVIGKGEKTIVLLSGLGNSSPIAYFGPLATKLSDKYKVVTIEYAGYGLSDDSSKEQTNSNFVAEIRDTLKALKIEPPYILMPHSASGIYCMKYITNYPNEVESMIGIESSVPNLSKYGLRSGLPTSLYYLARFADFTGLTRLYYLRSDFHYQSMDAGGAYSEEELKIVSTLRHRKLLSKAIFNELRNFDDNCKELYDVKFPHNIPVLYFLGDENCSYIKEQVSKTGYKNITWESLHKDTFSNPDIQKIKCLKGNHFLFWNQSQAIADLSDDFISGYSKTNAVKIKTSSTKIK